MLKINEITHFVLDQVLSYQRDTNLKKSFDWLPGVKKVDNSVLAELVYIQQLRESLEDTLIVVYQSPMFFSSQQKMIDRVKENEKRWLEQIKEVKEIINIALRSSRLGPKMTERLKNCLDLISSREESYRQLYCRRSRIEMDDDVEIPLLGRTYSL